MSTHSDATIGTPSSGSNEITPAQALQQQAAGALLVDVREDAEREVGMPHGALALPYSLLEQRIADEIPDRQRDILLLCASGQRSLKAVDALHHLGYAYGLSITGGFRRWQAEGLPIVMPAADVLDAEAIDRYARQLQLPQVGAKGQARLREARVAIVGAGGLGAPVALYLAAAGVGHISLIDDDLVERSNLHRQVIHADARVGMAKTQSAQMTLAALNPRVQVETWQQRLQAGNVEDLLRGHDLVIDGADNFPTRYLISAASLRLQVPMVYGAVERFSGQVSVFDPRVANSPCYRCLFPEPPAAADAPNCSEAGVLGVLPGVIGLLQATEALKLILGLGDSLAGRLLTFDALGMRFSELGLPRDPACPGCGEQAVFGGYADISRHCTT